jgi:(2Fe-2S) ferredoxin
MSPSYKYHVFVCQNQRPEGHQRGCCLSKGSDKILNYLKARVKALGLQNIRINKSGCLDQCENGPAVVIYPQGTWYTIRTIEEAEQLLQTQLAQDQIATNLIM